MSDDTSCQCGTPWVSKANDLIASRIDQSLKIETTDAIHPLEMMNPVHHPHLWNDCLNIKECVLNITTVSNTLYDTLDDYDISSNPYISGKEIMVKLKSEQSIWEAITGEKSELKKSDSNFCRDINKAAYDLALASLSHDRRKLYQNHGDEIVFDPDDEIYLMEPLWYLKPLSIKSEVRDGKNILIITSPSFKTSVDLKWKNVDLMAGIICLF